MMFDVGIAKPVDYQACHSLANILPHLVDEHV